MPTYEYKVVPAPRTADKEKGVKGTGPRFAVTLTRVMNEMGAEGWEYLRAETLPCDERKGLTGRVETSQTMLVFRRERAVVTRPRSETPPLSAAPPPRRSGATPRLVLDSSKRDDAPDVRD